MANGHGQGYGHSTSFVRFLVLGYVWSFWILKFQKHWEVETWTYFSYNWTISGYKIGKKSDHFGSSDHAMLRIIPISPITQIAVLGHQGMKISIPQFLMGFIVGIELPRPSAHQFYIKRLDIITGSSCGSRKTCPDFFRKSLKSQTHKTILPWILISSGGAGALWVSKSQLKLNAPKLHSALITLHYKLHVVHWYPKVTLH